MTTPLVGYIRVSTVAGREDERFLSPDLQRSAIERAAARAYPDGTFVAWHTDLDRTGTHQDRPGLDAAIADAVASGASIWIYNISRFARSVVGGLRDLDRLREAGVVVESASESLSTDTAIERFQVSIMLTVAELEAGQRGEGWRAVIAENRARGRWHGRAPVGYVLGAGPGELVIDETRGPLVVEAFERAASGHSVTEVGRWGVERGLWRRVNAPAAVLRNRAYLGEVPIVGGRRVPRRSRDGTIQRDRYGRVRWRWTERSWAPGAHEPLIDAATFESVQARLASRWRPRVTRGAWWGTGRVRCSGCGAAVYRDRKRTVAGDEYILLRCHAAKHCGWSGSPRLDQVERDIVLALRRALAGATRPPDPPPDGDPIGDARAALDEARARLARAAADALRQGLDDATRDAIVADLRRDVDDAEARLAKTLARATITPTASEAVVDLGQELAAAWPTLDDQARREALAALDVTVLVDGAGRVRLRAPWRARAH